MATERREASFTREMRLECHEFRMAIVTDASGARRAMMGCDVVLGARRRDTLARCHSRKKKNRRHLRRDRLMTESSARLFHDSARAESMMLAPGECRERVLRISLVDASLLKTFASKNFGTKNATGTRFTEAMPPDWQEYRVDGKCITGL